MALSTDPRYIALARRAATALGAPSDAIAAAILAQWQCEQPNPAPWPPLRNNPGNLTTAIGTLAGPIPGSVSLGTVRMIVYPTPGAGADAYAAYLLHSSRYVKAIEQARAGAAAAFLEDVCAAGYGTRWSCAGAVLSTIHLAPVPAPVPVPVVHRWRAAYDGINIRTAPSIGAPIVGHIDHGTIVSGPEVMGGPYHAGNATYYGWIQLGPGRFAAHAFFAQL